MKMKRARRGAASRLRSATPHPPVLYQAIRDVPRSDAPAPPIKNLAAGPVVRGLSPSCFLSLSLFHHPFWAAPGDKAWRGNSALGPLPLLGWPTPAWLGSQSRGWANARMVTAAAPAHAPTPSAPSVLLSAALRSWSSRGPLVGLTEDGEVVVLEGRGGQHDMSAATRPGGPAQSGRGVAYAFLY